MQKTDELSITSFKSLLELIVSDTCCNWVLNFSKELLNVTKEDEEVLLNLEQVIAILQGIAQVQSEIWVLKYKGFINKINNAETADEIRAIVIDYTIDFTKED